MARWAAEEMARGAGLDGSEVVLAAEIAAEGTVRVASQSVEGVEPRGPERTDPRAPPGSESGLKGRGGGFEPKTSAFVSAVIESAEALEGRFERPSEPLDPTALFPEGEPFDPDDLWDLL